MTEKTSQKARLSARLMAVQAVYQSLQTGGKLDDVGNEFIARRLAEAFAPPDTDLFRFILKSVEGRGADLQAVIVDKISNKEKSMESLLRAVLLCAAAELLENHETDPPVIINDYLDVAHGFYDANEVGLLNAILDAIAKGIKAG